ncbi:hypothetical protein [Roseixanthobacter pseudopolyaromaticivorans]|uniref:hypothetical protein n=1 Tax=Xanthobacteraceae TaxID=335928 RepID=UPI00372768BA
MAATASGRIAWDLKRVGRPLRQGHRKSDGQGGAVDPAGTDRDLENRAVSQAAGQQQNDQEDQENAADPETMVSVAAASIEHSSASKNEDEDNDD